MSRRGSQTINTIFLCNVHQNDFAGFWNPVGSFWGYFWDRFRHDWVIVGPPKGYRKQNAKIVGKIIAGTVTNGFAGP